MSGEQVPLHLVGTQDFFPALLAYVQSFAKSTSLPLDHVIFQSILLCLIAGDKNLILRAPEEDIGLTVKLAVWTLSSVFNLTTHKVKIRSRTPSSRAKTGSTSSADPAAFLRSLFLSSTSSSHHLSNAPQDEGSPDNVKHLSHQSQQTPSHSRAAKIKLKQPQPEYARSRSFPNNLANAAHAQSRGSSTSPDAPLTQNMGPNPEATSISNNSSLNAPTIVKPQPLYPHVLPHAFTDPLPLPPRRRRKSQPKQLAQLPQALVISGLEHASFSVQRAFIDVLMEKKVVIEGQATAMQNDMNKPSGDSTSGQGTWDLPEGFLVIYVCAWDAKERPAIHKTLLDRFAMSSNVFISQKTRHDWNMLLFPPSPRSLHSNYMSHSNPGSPSPGYPSALPSTHTPPIFTKSLPFHHRHSSHSVQPHPPPLPDQVLPPAVIKTLQEVRQRTHMSHRLELYLADIFSATRHFPPLDAMLLTARSKRDAEDLARASRVIGRDLTGMELLRPPIVAEADEGLSAHESEELLTSDYIRLSRLQSSTSASSSLLPIPREDPDEDIKGAIQMALTRELDVSEVDIARIVPRVISHRVRMRKGPEDEVLASALYGATFKPKIPDAALSEGDQSTIDKLHTVKAVLVHILAEV